MRIYNQPLHPALAAALNPRQKSAYQDHTDAMNRRDAAFYPPDESQAGPPDPWVSKALAIFSRLYDLTSNGRPVDPKKLRKVCREMLDDYRATGTDAQGGSVDKPALFGPEDPNARIKGFRGKGYGGMPSDGELFALYAAERAAAEARDRETNQFFEGE